MNRGIVKIRPQGTQKGMIEIDEADQNPYGVQIGSRLNYYDTDPPVDNIVGSVVEVELINDGYCRITRRIA